MCNVDIELKEQSYFLIFYCTPGAKLWLNTSQNELFHSLIIFQRGDGPPSMISEHRILKSLAQNAKSTPFQREEDVEKWIYLWFLWFGDEDVEQKSFPEVLQ